VVQRRLVSNAAPDLIRIDFLVRIQLARSFQENLRRFRIERIRSTAIVDGTDRCALWFIEVSHTFRAPVMCNDVNVVTSTLAFPNVVAFGLGITAGFKNGLVGTFGEAGPAGDTLFRD